MRDDANIDPAMPVDTFLSRFPQAAAVFVAYGMACAGCLLSQFHTLAEAAQIYGLSLPQLLEELGNSLGQQE
jgi:hybrid cluster-associated redox disulfide protein